MAVPNIFANVTTTIPLSQLDANFATAITLGNTAVYLGNTTTTIGNLTLTNANISSVSAAITPAQGGTGLTTLTANNVLIGNGTSNVTFVAPGTSGNVLASNGTTWVSQAAASGTSISNGTSNVSVNSSGGNVTVATAGTTAMTIDTSQNVGIGTSSPSSYGKFAIRGGITASINGTNFSGISFEASDAANSSFYVNHTSGVTNLMSDAALSFSTGNPTVPTERARIDTSGNLLVGTTNAAFNAGSGVKLGLDTTGPAVVCVGAGNSASYNSYFIYSTTAGANRFYVSYAGQINATATSIQAISDISLKENIRDLETGLNEVMALRPRRFDWKEETKLEQKGVAGFIAQELEPVLPDLVYDYQYNETEIKKSIKMGDILPTLVKAVQELKALVDAQATEIAQLKAKVG